MPNLNSPSVEPPERPHSTRRRDTAESLERLLEGARSTFAERGYHAANVHEICARSNVGIGTFYAHFDHKAQLLRHLMSERAVPLSRLLSAADLTDSARLATKLRSAVDDPVSAGLWRAWHEAVEEDQELARLHAAWRASTLDELTALVGEARRHRPAKARRMDPSAVAWTMMTFARELTIHDRYGAPTVEVAAGMIRDLVLGPGTTG